MTDSYPSSKRFPLPEIVTFGFGTAVFMWLTGFVTHLPGLGLPPPVIALLLLGVLFAGGFFAARGVSTGRALVGSGTGLVASILNLLIVGSVIASDSSESALRPGWAVVVIGTLVSGAVIGLAGGLLAGRPVSVPCVRDVPESRRWLGRFGVVAVLSALPVILSGGLVTSTGAGLAVPDWPTSYGANMFLYPLSKMTGGIYYEHAHRLFGSLVGLTTLTLLVFTLIAEPRKWVKGVALLAFLAVCGQGVLGGIRVTAADQTADASLLTDNKGSLALAMVHGVTAQLFFALLCAMAAILSAGWISQRGDAPAGDRATRRLAIALFIALVVQLCFGSAARHMHHMHALWSHVGFAVIVIALAALTAFRAIGHHRDFAPVRRLGHALLHSTVLQTALGLATLMAVLPYQPGKEDSTLAVVLATAHQGIGALLIGSAAMLLAWTVRLKSPASAPGG